MSLSDDPRPTLLLTRPQEGAERFARAFQGRFGTGWPIVIAPLMQIEALRPDLPEADILIFTSQHGAEAFAALSPARGRLAYCVGARTAEAAARAGFRAIASGGDAAALLAQIVRERPVGVLLHARGEAVAQEIAKPLNAAGIETKEAVVYGQRPCEMTPEGRAILASSGDIVVPLFSPQSVALFREAANGATARLHLVAISDAAARRCDARKFARVTIADRPDSVSMLDATARVIRDLMPG